MDVYSSQITNLVEQLSHLPGIGAKSAQRLAFHILNMTEEQVAGLSGAMMSAKKNVHYCKECCTYTDGEICPICANPKRNHRQIMVVENTRDLAAYEKTGKFDGVYHVLHGAISPILAFICWYAKGKSKLALILSSMILAILFNMTFIFGDSYFEIPHSYVSIGPTQPFEIKTIFPALFGTEFGFEYNQ